MVSLEKQILNVINRLQELERCPESCKNIKWVLNPENETRFTEFRKAIEGVDTAKNEHQNADNALDEAAEATRESDKRLDKIFEEHVKYLKALKEE